MRNVVLKAMMTSLNMDILISPVAGFIVGMLPIIWGRKISISR